MADRLRVGVVQLNTPDNPGDGTGAAVSAVRRAAAAGADIICTPETTHVMPRGRASALQVAAYEGDDAGLRALRAEAAAAQVWLNVGSLIIKLSPDRLVNRQYVINPSGEVVARYDKMHLFDVNLGAGEVYSESALYQAGQELVTVACTPGDTALKLGLSICFDVRFPALYQALAHSGAHLLTVPAAFTRPTGSAHWHILLRSRAIETGCFVVAAAQTGEHANGRKTFGHSLVIGPWGDVLLDAGDTVGEHVVEIDLSQIAESRRKMPTLDLARDISTQPPDAPLAHRD